METNDILLEMIYKNKCKLDVFKYYQAFWKIITFYQKGYIKQMHVKCKYYQGIQKVMTFY